jgi:predicted  nucleic acid-binding Zn-ribbon protein
VEAMIKFCPKCGWIERQIGIEECWFCKTPLEDTSLSYIDYKAMSEAEYIYWRQTYPKKHIHTLPTYDPQMDNARTAEWCKRNLHGYSERSSAPRCPKCGHTKFQMVQRKWSPFMGFFTNKVDRVCENCKTRF